MGNEGRPIRVGEPLPLQEQGAAELLDPVALEERLREARARRAAALAGRSPAAAPPRPGFAEVAATFLHGEAHAAPATAAEPFGVLLSPVPAPPEPTVAPDAAQPVVDLLQVPEPPLRRLVRVPVWAIFVTGLALGAAVVAIVALAPAAHRPAATEAAAPDPAPALVAAAPEPAAQPAPPVSAPEPAAVAIEAAAPSPAVAPPPSVATAAVAPAPTAVEPPPAADLAPPASEAPVPAPALDAASLDPAEPPVPAAAPVPTPEAPATPPLAEAPGPLPDRVTINYPPSAAAEAARASAALAAAGVTRVGTIPVRLGISRSNVRFYHPGDGAAASTVAALLGDGGEAPLTRDFTDYKTPAAAGTVEVWLSGDSGRGSAPPTRPRPAAATKAPATPEAAPEPTLPVAGTFVPDSYAPLPEPTAPPAPPGPQDQAQAVARIIVERAYERLMRAMPSR